MLLEYNSNPDQTKVMKEKIVLNKISQLSKMSKIDYPCTSVDSAGLRSKHRN